jgi:hypothetical protein
MVSFTLVREGESSLVGFGGMDDNPIKGLTSVEQVLNAKLIGLSIGDQV